MLSEGIFARSEKMSHETSSYSGAGCRNPRLSAGEAGERRRYGMRQAKGRLWAGRARSRLRDRNVPQGAGCGYKDGNILQRRRREAGGKIPSQGGLSFQAVLRKRRALRLDIQPVEGYAVCDCRQHGRELAKAGIRNVGGHIYSNRAGLFERGPRNGSRCRAGSKEG